MLHELRQVFAHPYDEQPEYEAKYVCCCIYVWCTFVHSTLAKIAQTVWDTKYKYNSLTYIYIFSLACITHYRYYIKSETALKNVGGIDCMS